VNLGACSEIATGVAELLAIVGGCAETWTPRPLSVILTMAMTVADPAAFIADPDSKIAVEAGIAAAAGVTADKVDATLTVGTRRLQGSNRRLQGTVDVSAEIQAENAAAVADLQSSVNEITPDAMATNLNAALTEAGLPTVEVAALSAAAASPPARYVAAPPDETAPPNESGACNKIVLGGGALLALALQA